MKKLPRNLTSFSIVVICFCFSKSFCQPHFFLSIYKHNSYGVQRIIDKGGNVNEHLHGECFPLTYAVMFKDIEIIKLLLKNGAKFDICPDLHTSMSLNPECFSSLYLAISYNQIDIVKLFYEYGCDFTKPLNAKKITYPIIVSAGLGDTTIFDYLLEKGVDVTVKNDNGENALMVCVATNNLEVTKNILQKGCPVNDTSNDGITPLMSAAMAYKINSEIISLLVSKGADMNYSNKRNQSAFSLACRYNNLELALFLYENGVKAIDSDIDFESSARMNHFLGNYYLDKNNIDSSKLYYEKAKPFYQLCTSTEKEKLRSVNNKQLSSFMLEALSGSIGSLQASKQASMEADKMGKILRMNNSQISKLQTQYTEQNRIRYSPYQESLFYDFRLPAMASLEVLDTYYKNRIKQFEMSISLIDDILKCFDEKLTGQELNTCVRNIQASKK